MTAGTSRTAPTQTIVVWGGTIIENPEYSPSGPTFEMVMVASWTSWGSSLSSRALTTSDFNSRAKSAMDLF